MESNRNSDIQQKVIEIIQKIKTCREISRLSQAELATKAGISQGFLAMIESGKKVPTITSVLKICQALEIAPEYLFMTGEQNRQKVKEEIIKKLCYGRFCNYLPAGFHPGIPQQVFAFQVYGLFNKNTG